MNKVKSTMRPLSRFMESNFEDNLENLLYGQFYGFKTLGRSKNIPNFEHIKIFHIKTSRREISRTYTRSAIIRLFVHVGT